MAMTDDEIKALLNSFFETQARTTYVGSRYVPIFGREGSQVIDWDNKAPYEPLTVVLHEGNSFTSRCYVPADIDIMNADFWAKTGDFNAQVEAYRNEVAAFSGRIDAVEADNATINETVDTINETVDTINETVGTIKTDVNGKAPIKHDSLTNEYGVGTPTRYGHLRISDEVSNTNGVDVAITPKGAYDTATKLVQEGVQPIHDYIDGKFPVDTTDIKDNAVTTAKVANSSITRAKLSGLLPIVKDDLAAGSVTSTKMNDSAINAVLSNIVIRHFDTRNINADNGGITALPKGYVEGIYIPAFKFLYIITFDIENDRPNARMPLPDYVPRVSQPLRNKFCAVFYNSSNSMIDWDGLMVHPDGSIGMTNEFGAYPEATEGAGGGSGFYLYNAVGSTVNGFNSYENDNGVM